MLSTNGYRIYVDIMTGENCCQFRLLTWNSFIGQFVYPVGGEGMSKYGGWGVSLFEPTARFTFF